MLALAGGALVLLAMHPFTTYPLSLRLLARWRPQPVRGGAEAPRRVALCVCAYNEERVIRAKVENMLAMRGAIPSLEVLVYLDGASDRTAEILDGYRDRLQLVVSSERHGKTHGMNTLVEPDRRRVPGVQRRQRDVRTRRRSAPAGPVRRPGGGRGVRPPAVHRPGRQRDGDDRLALLASRGAHQGAGKRHRLGDGSGRFDLRDTARAAPAGACRT